MTNNESPTNQDALNPNRHGPRSCPACGSIISPTAQDVEELINQLQAFASEKGIEFFATIIEKREVSQERYLWFNNYRIEWARDSDLRLRLQQWQCLMTGQFRR